MTETFNFHGHEEKSVKLAPLGKPPESEALRYRFSSKNTAYHLTAGSYPVLLVGGCGSGRTRATLALLEQNFKDHQPFIYLNSYGDTSVATILGACAKDAGTQDDLYVLNGFADEFSTAATNTFDPLNPLVGHVDLFRAVFGESVGAYLNEQCERIHRDGALVDYDKFEEFFGIPFISDAVRDSQAFPETTKYFGANHSSAKHERNISKARQIIASLRSMPMCSFEPDLDLKSIIVEKKYLCVILQSTEIDPDRLKCIEDLVLAHAAMAVQHSAKESACPSLVMSGGHPWLTSPELIDKLRKTNTVFSYCDDLFYASEKTEKHWSLITKISNSVIIMKSELIGDGFPNHLKINAFNNGVSSRSFTLREMKMQGPGKARAWGCIYTQKLGFFSGKLKTFREWGIKRMDLNYANPPLNGYELKFPSMKIAKPIV